MAEAISLFAALKQRQVSVGQRGARMTIEFTAPDISFQADEHRIAQLACEAIAQTVRENLQTGRAPDGTPMPAAALATVIRREYRADQLARGGQPSDRYKDPKFRSRAVKAWKRRFIAAQLGEFQPKSGARTFGSDSGMLAASPRAVPSADGNGWTCWFAAARSKPDKKGRSAVERVFTRIPVWSKAAMEQPKIQEALRNVAQGLLVNRAGKLLGELMRTVKLTQQLAEEGQP